MAGKSSGGGTGGMAGAMSASTTKSMKSGASGTAMNYGSGDSKKKKKKKALDGISEGGKSYGGGGDFESEGGPAYVPFKFKKSKRYI